MSKIPFNVSANTARLIGRENIANLDGAIIELIKNTYDADAGICILYYDQSVDCVWLIDNGSGTTEDIIRQNWMTIGNSSKTKNYKTESGRIQTGEKGIGRFALDRVSSECHMHTVSRDSNFSWKINWEQFEQVDLISNVYAEFYDSVQTIEDFCTPINNINILRMLEEYDFSTGTAFRLERPRESWSTELVEHLHGSLSKMLPPDMSENYRLYFFVDDEMSEKDARIESVFVDTYDYRITFGIVPRVAFNESNFEVYEYDYQKHLKLVEDNPLVPNSEKVCIIVMHRNEFDFGSKRDHILEVAGFSTEDAKYFDGKRITYIMSIEDLLPKMPDVDLGFLFCDLYFYKIASQEHNVARYYYKEFSNRGRNYKDISGIKIYRDGFLVRPYGIIGLSGYDWLDLSTRKAGSPAGASHKKGNWRVHVNQMCGQVHISRLNATLPDKSSREGIIETPEFALFRELIVSVIELFEQDRQYVIRKLNDLYIKESEGAAALDLAKEVLSDFDNEEKSGKKSKTSNESSKSAYTTFQKAIEYQGERIESLEEEIGLLRALATTGVLVDTYMHEIKALTTKMNMGIKEALEILTDEEDLDKAVCELSKLRQMRNSFNSWFKVTLDAVQKDKRKMKKHNVNVLIKDSINAWRKVQNDTINYHIHENSLIETRCFPYDIESVINNLIANSMTAFKGCAIQSPEVTITLDQVENYYIIEYQDNGPGLSDAFKKDPSKILLQGKTDKRDAFGATIGTGMGLWIVNSIIQDYDGFVDVDLNRERETGFVIKLFFRERKERSR